MRPQDSEIIEVIVSIDTTRKIGATTVYGWHEFQSIVEEGCKQKGYNLHIDYKGGKDKTGIVFID